MVFLRYFCDYFRYTFGLKCTSEYGVRQSGDRNHATQLMSCIDCHVGRRSSIMTQNCSFGAYGHQQRPPGAKMTIGTAFGRTKAAKGRLLAINSWRRLCLTTNGRQVSAVHTNKRCAFDVERHQRRDLRAVTAKGTAFGAMAATTNEKHGSPRSAGGQSSVFVSGTMYSNIHSKIAFGALC